jgi:hypothetical protein
MSDLPDITQLPPQGQAERIEHDASEISANSASSQAASTEFLKELNYLREHPDTANQVKQILMSDTQKGNVDAYVGYVEIVTSPKDQGSKALEELPVKVPPNK